MTINLFSLAVAGMLLWWISVDIMLDKNRKKYFQLCIVLSMIVIGAELGCVLTDNTNPELRGFSIFFNILGFGVSPFVFLAEANCYTSKAFKNPGTKSIRRFWYMIPALICLILVLLSPSKGWIFYVAPDCTYMRGNFYSVYLATFIFSVCWSGVKKLQVAQNLPTYFRRRIVSSEIILGGGLFLQVIFPELHTTWIIVTICLIFFYALTCQMDSILDGLTGLLNRTAFNRILEHHYSDLRKRKKNMMLMMLDVNDFKQVNDKCGHSYGDYCLKQVADILKKAAPKGTQVFRFGGDEFTAIFPSKPASSLDSFKSALEALIGEHMAKEPDFPEVAVGFAEFEQGKTLDEVMNLADSRMYDEKKRMKREKTMEKPLSL